MKKDPLNPRYIRVEDRTDPIIRQVIKIEVVDQTVEIEDHMEIIDLDKTIETIIFEGTLEGIIDIMIMTEAEIGQVK